MKSFYNQYLKEFLMEELGFVNVHMEQHKINSKKRSMKFIKILLRKCESFKRFMKTLDEYVDEECEDFIAYNEAVEKLDVKKSVLKQRLENEEKAKRQKKLDEERIQRAEHDKQQMDLMSEGDKGQKSGGATGFDPNILSEKQSGNMIWAVNYSKKT